MRENLVEARGTTLAVAFGMQILHRCVALTLALSACREPAQDDGSPIPQLAHVKGGVVSPLRLVEAHRPVRDIVQNGPTDFDVERAVIDRLLEQQAELMRCTRVVPEHDRGRVGGFRVFAPPDSLLARLGIENGDTIEAINGFDIASPEKALAVYTRLRNADVLTVALRRRGARMEIEYRIW